MDFIYWWFDQHYILSTVFTPVLALAWCVFKGLFIRGVVALILVFLYWGGS